MLKEQEIKNNEIHEESAFHIQVVKETELENGEVEFELEMSNNTKIFLEQEAEKQNLTIEEFFKKLITEYTENVIKNKENFLDKEKNEKE